MNNSVQTSTKFTPFYLMFHRESKVPCDNLFDNPPDTKGMYDSTKILDIYEQAKRNLLKEQLRHKVLHDKIHKAKIFNIGDRVMVYNPVNQPGKSPKLTLKWKGPYVITRKISDVTYVLKPEFQKRRRAEEIQAHVGRMKEFRERTINKSLSPDDTNEPMTSVKATDKTPLLRTRIGREIKLPARYLN